MNKLICRFGVLAIVTMLSACNAVQPGDYSNIATAKTAIAESNRVYFQSFIKNDSSIFINRYSQDACILAPNAPMACGPAAAAKFFRDAYDVYGMRNSRFITMAIYGDGLNFVTEEGLWQSIDASGKVFDNGKFLVLWKKTTNGWKMYRDSYSSNLNNVNNKNDEK